MLARLRQRWFLLALILVLTAGMAAPGLIKPWAYAIPRQVIVAVVMFIMALPLETSAMWNAIRRPGPAWLAAAINAGLAPPLGWLAGHLLTPELATGLIVTTTVPCTLAAAAVWTRRAGGNDAVAILVTMITNLACFLVVPFWLRLLIGADVEIDMDYRRLAMWLMLLVVVPIIVAQLLRQLRPLGHWATEHKVGLSAIAQVGILSMVLIGAVGCGLQLREMDNGATLTAGNLATMILVVAVVHLVLLAVGMLASRTLGMARPEQIAVGIAGSQKTLMVGLYLALEFGPLAILPMVGYHAMQLLLDTLIADWLRGRGEGSGVGGQGSETSEGDS